MENKDLVGLGEAVKEGKEPIMKFLDILEKCFGSLAKTLWLDKVNTNNEIYKAKALAQIEFEKQKLLTDAKVYEINNVAGAISQNSIVNTTFEDGKVKIASPEKDKLVIERKTDETTVNLTTNNIENRAIDRLLIQEVRKQNNIEKVLQVAYNEAVNEQEFSNEDVDDDWLNRFFNYAGDVSNEEMQTIWGKILAGEIKQPNSYSIRVLEVLRNLTQEEANIFLNFVKYSFVVGNRYFIFKEFFDTNSMNTTFEHLLLLSELNLLTLQPLRFHTDSLEGLLIYGKWVLRITPKFGNNVYAFSFVGSQLAKLAADIKDLQYIKLIHIKLPHLKIEYSIITKIYNEGLEYDDVWKNISDL